MAGARGAGVCRRGASALVVRWSWLERYLLTWLNGDRRSPSSGAWCADGGEAGEVVLWRVWSGARSPCGILVYDAQPTPYCRTSSASVAREGGVRACVDEMHMDGCVLVCVCGWMRAGTRTDAHKPTPAPPLPTSKHARTHAHTHTCPQPPASAVGDCQKPPAPSGAAACKCHHQACEPHASNSGQLAADACAARGCVQGSSARLLACSVSLDTWTPGSFCFCTGSVGAGR